MTDTLVTLVGEQPLPALLVSRQVAPKRTVLVCTGRTQPVAQRLRSLVPGGEVLPLDEAYRLDHLRAALVRSGALRPGEATLFDLTGGTKPMALALYDLATALMVPFVYLQSEGPRSVLYLYAFEKKGAPPALEQTSHIPPLLTLNLYLQAHLGNHTSEEVGQQEAGHLFEQAVAAALRTCCDEVKVNVRGGDRGQQQVELDAVFRVGNRVGVAEVGLAKTSRDKRGLEQLALATWPTALGTYTAPFLILAGGLPAGLHALAEVRRVEVIGLKDYFRHLRKEGTPPASLSDRDAQTIAEAVAQRLR